MLQDEQCMALFSHMFVTTAVDDRVELKIDVNNAAKAVLKKFSTTMDSRPSIDNHEDIEIYTSKYYFNVLKVVSHWKRRMSRKKYESGMDTRLDCKSPE